MLEYCHARNGCFTTLSLVSCVKISPFFASTHLVFWYLRREPENKRKLFRPWEVNDTWRNSPEICQGKHWWVQVWSQTIWYVYIFVVCMSKCWCFASLTKLWVNVRCTSWIMAHWHKWDPVFNFPQECSLTPFQNLIKNKENPSDNTKINWKLVPQKPLENYPNIPLSPPKQENWFLRFLRVSSSRNMWGFFAVGKPIPGGYENSVLLEIAMVVRDESHMTKVWLFIGRGSWGV